VLRAAERLEKEADLGVEAEQADTVAGLERAVAEQQPGADRMVELRDAGQRLAHQVAGIQRDDDLVIAFGPILLADQPAMPRRVLPVDAPPVEPRDMFAQRIELRSDAELGLRLDAVERLPGGQPDRLVMHPADIGQDADAPLDRPAQLPPDQAPRALPAQPQRRELGLSA